GRPGPPFLGSVLLAEQKNEPGRRAGTRHGPPTGKPYRAPKVCSGHAAHLTSCPITHGESRQCKASQCKATLQAAASGEATPFHWRGGWPGIRPGGRPLLLLRQKKRQEKATRVCRPATRGSHAVGTEIGKRRKLAALRQPPLLIRFRYRRRGGIQRGALQRPKQLQRHKQRPRNGKATATATTPH
ncbi:MAG: hypothetical protein JWR22_2153, partial [Herminiimonas sp.]|nr:hypothetical protein [Herminiimonas sp.]